MKEKSKLNKEEILIITAETGYEKVGLEKSGYYVLHPYNYKTIVGRIFLEVLKKFKLSQTVIFNKKIIKNCKKYIIVEDSIVTQQFLIWLKIKCPNSRILFKYTNMIGQAHHILPNEVPDGIEIWTYDKYDSDKYGIKLSECGGYLTSYIGEKREKEYDVMYVGKDKGRADEILSLQKQFESMGLKTIFLIMPTTRTSAKKSFYSKPIPYEDVIELVTKSRAILNIALPNQEGATLRDYESLFNEVKLITTNKNIKKFDFYNSNNIFILAEDEMKDLPEFVRSSYEKIDDSIVNRYSLDVAIEEILQERGEV